MCLCSLARSLVLVKARGVGLGWTAGPLAGPGSLAASINGAACARTHTQLLVLLAGRVSCVLALLALCVCVSVCVCVWPAAGGAAGSPGAERRHRSQIRVRIRASNPLVEGEEAPVRARRSNRTVAGARPAPRPVS